jgi:hypothetical protein
MTNSIGASELWRLLHESQATLYWIVGNAAVKLPDVALALCTSGVTGAWRPELSGACANISLCASPRT